jgi:hypothetical protein
MNTTPGWYPDPRAEQSMLRWWDGERWTANARAVPAARSRSFWRFVLWLLAAVSLIGSSVVVALIVLSALLSNLSLGNK